MGIENPVHLIFLAAVALIVLGPKRLPELARAAGKGMREFRESLNGEGAEEEPAGAVVVQPAVASPAQQVPPPQQASEQQVPPSQQVPPQQPQAQLLSGAPQGLQPVATPPDSPT
jgi:sec-independent protein translocase protein TatA